MCIRDRDYVQAEKWYRRAGLQGDLESQKRLGDIYYHGTGPVSYTHLTLPTIYSV